MATAAASAGTVRPAVDARVSRSLWSNAWYKLRHDRLTIAAMAVLVLLAILSVLAPVFADNVFHYKFEQQDLFHTYEKPTFDPPAYLLGSDEVGRSQVVRLLYGGQVSLFVGFVAAIDVGAIVLLESALSFLGLGILPPTPSWGNMLTNGASYFVRAWWLVVSPGVMIFLTVLCLYLIGDGLRDALDPRLKTHEVH